MVKYSTGHPLFWLTTFLVLLTTSASAAQVNVQSVFHISKSQNRNQVHYNVKVNSQNCLPIRSNPVNAIWHMRERGRNEREQLNGVEQPLYGIGRQTVSGNRVTFSVRGVDDKPIELITSESNGECNAKAYTRINGKKRQLSSGHVQLSWTGLAVKYLELRASDGKTERI